MAETNFERLSPEDLVARLVVAGQLPDPALLARIREVGGPCVPLLVRVVEDEELADQNAAGQGWAPCVAARLLGEMHAKEAIEPLLRVLIGLDGMDVLFNDVMIALPKMGDALVEPALKAYARSDDPAYRDLMCDALAQCGTMDERIWQVLVEQLKRSPDNGAANMAYYGDDRALPLLIEALDAQQPDQSGAWDDSAIIELCASVEDLGGKLTEAQREKRERAVGQRKARYLARAVADKLDGLGDDDDDLDEYDDGFYEPQEPYVRETPKVGRNEPCPCGSGKKYKKCHGA